MAKISVKAVDYFERVHLEQYDLWDDKSMGYKTIKNVIRSRLVYRTGDSAYRAFTVTGRKGILKQPTKMNTRTKQGYMRCKVWRF